MESPTAFANTTIVKKKRAKKTIGIFYNPRFFESRG
jgi:hypothetical protein